MESTISFDFASKSLLCSMFFAGSCDLLSRALCNVKCEIAANLGNYPRFSFCLSGHRRVYTQGSIGASDSGGSQMGQPCLVWVWQTRNFLISFDNDSASPAAINARTHSEEQTEQIARSIKTFGSTNPVLIDPDGTLTGTAVRLNTKISFEITGEA